MIAALKAMVLSTPAANEAFKAAFTLPATAALSRPVESADSKDLYTSLGKLWAAGHRAVQALEGPDQHRPAADSSLKDDVAVEVETTLDVLWITHKTRIGGVGSVVEKSMPQLRRTALRPHRSAESRSPTSRSTARPTATGQVTPRTTL